MNFRKTSYVSEKENIVPMINIVFLLLIFFLITSFLVSRPGEIIERPFGLTDAQVEDPNYLFVTSSSEIMYLGESGEIAWNGILFQLKLLEEVPLKRRYKLGLEVQH